MKKQQFKKKAKEARKPSKLAKVKKTCTSKINLDIQENWQGILRNTHSVARD